MERLRKPSDITGLEFILSGCQGFLDAIYQSYRDMIHIPVGLNVRLRLVTLELYTSIYKFAGLPTNLDGLLLDSYNLLIYLTGSRSTPLHNDIDSAEEVPVSACK